MNKEPSEQPDIRQGYNELNSQLSGALDGLKELADEAIRDHPQLGEERQQLEMELGNDNESKQMLHTAQEILAAKLEAEPDKDEAEEQRLIGVMRLAEAYGYLSDHIHAGEAIEAFGKTPIEKAVAWGRFVTASGMPVTYKNVAAEIENNLQTREFGFDEAAELAFEQFGLAFMSANGDMLNRATSRLQALDRKNHKRLLPIANDASEDLRCLWPTYFGHIPVAEGHLSEYEDPNMTSADLDIIRTTDINRYASEKSIRGYARGWLNNDLIQLGEHVVPHVKYPYDKSEAYTRLNEDRTIIDRITKRVSEEREQYEVMARRELGLDGDSLAAPERRQSEAALQVKLKAWLAQREREMAAIVPNADFDQCVEVAVARDMLLTGRLTVAGLVEVKPGEVEAA